MAAWLDLVSDAEGWSLVDTGRFEELVQGMSHAKEQYPSLIYFAGNGARINALRALFPHNNVTRKGPSGLARLHISTSTAHTQNPTIFVEGNPFTQKGLGDTKSLRGSAEKHRRFPMSGPNGSQPLATVQQDVIKQFILPWTQILCLFVSSASEMKQAQDLLQGPSRKLTVGNQPLPELMRLMIILTHDNHSNKDESASEVRDSFTRSRITILDLRSRAELSDAAAFEPLRSLLLEDIQAVHEDRRANGLVFSAFHLRALWDASIRSHERIDPRHANLDCLSVARETRHASSVMLDCLAEFRRQAESTACPVDQIEEQVASAFLMDAYPPEMHYFQPELVFNALYQAQCLDAWRDDEPRIHAGGVLVHFVRSFAELGCHKSSAIVRQQKIATFYRQWGGLRSTAACLLCMCRQPDLDGGGVRGIIQLGLLRALEERLGGISVVEIPDQCTGTSVGALTEMDLFFNGSSAGESFARFPSLARGIFRASAGRMAPSFLRGLNLIRGCVRMLVDGLYDTRDLEDTLKHAIDPQRRMFDVPGGASPAGCRVAIITSRTSDGKACVLANYRGLGQRDTDAAYVFLAPQSEAENPFLWEAGLCSVAAPGFFRAKSLVGFGPMQDGGVRANNPLAIALKESTVIWPSAKKHDLLLSVGTGYSLPASEPTRGPFNALREGALPRMIRAMISSPCMDGRQGYHEALNYIPELASWDIFRLDHGLRGSLPRLDDIEKLTEMSDIPFGVPDTLVRAILATAFFFFELDDIPVKGHGGYFCRGSILCSRENTPTIVKGVLAEFPGARFRTAQDYHLGPVGEHDGCSDCGYYRKKVTFSVGSLQEEFTIQICGNTSSQRIGGFPKSVQQLTHEQQAYAHFGRADHVSAAWPPKRSCHCFQGSKRNVRFVEPGLEYKKRRL
ncbi:hypothetical protein POX_c04583 [Penicillium oxalicum]|uniref:hypothetical protein n=1 Tax=Penicillium oxalicum TaxID=69781 RepID=UPI0020B6CF06|nr:hypothetical protein POX_c04583 [Penicillium oxalicum]KAI2791711.1 hypothetical protein POX_c04583 [Penicillium oxalicum]